VYKRQLVFGAALALGPLAFDRGPILKNFAAAAAAPVAVAVLLRDGEISRGEAMLLLAGFFTWLFAVLVDALRQRHEAAPANAGLGFTRSSIFSLVGLALLIVAGKMIVMGAGRIARDYGLSEFVIGSTLVAIGTSTPELATAIISRLRKHDDIGVGALLGSNIFNGLFIVGVAGAISPIHAPLIEATPALGFGLTALIIAFPPADGVYRRWRGFALLMLHAAFLAATVWVER
ncbi:MAG: hypothetical protein N2444_10000, partial [Methylocystis sp.]|nr:hypothetical protein [Methylocystis sp.]